MEAFYPICHCQTSSTESFHGVESAFSGIRTMQHRELRCTDLGEMLRPISGSIRLECSRPMNVIRQYPGWGNIWCCPAEIPEAPLDDVNLCDMLRR